MALAGLDDFTIEVPSWAYGNSGTRFKVFGAPGVPRNPFEKIADAAQVQAVTGLAPRVSLHIPWDRVEDYGALATHAKELGVRIGAINSNLFQDDDYKLGSLTHADARVRAKAVAHHLECIQVMRETGSTDLKIWLPDGTNYAGAGLAAGAAGAAGRLAPAGLRGAGRRPAAAAGVQVLRAVLLRDGHPGLGHLAAALPGAGRAGAGGAGHRPPRAGHEHRVHRDAAAAAEPVGRVRLQLPLLRRRRPDGRLGGPVPAVPDHGRDRVGRRAPPGVGRELHARPVPQHRGRRSPARSARCSTWSRRWPRRCSSTPTRSPRPSRPATCWARTAC